MVRPLGLRGTAAYDGPVALAAAIVSGSENLHGARCTEYPRLFDPDVDHAALGYPTREARRAAVEQTCISCPVRARCWDWSTSISPNRVAGPTASTSHVASALWPRNRRRRAAAVPAPEDHEPEIAPPRPAQPRGARSKVRPSVNRKRRRNRRRRR